MSNVLDDLFGSSKKKENAKKTTSKTIVPQPAKRNLEAKSRPPLVKVNVYNGTTDNKPKVVGTVSNTKFQTKSNPNLYQPEPSSRSRPPVRPGENITYRRQKDHGSSQSGGDDLSRASSISNLNAEIKGAKKKSASKDRLDNVQEKRLDKKDCNKNNHQLDDVNGSLEEVEILQHKLEIMAGEKEDLVQQLGEQRGQLSTLQMEITRLKMIQDQSLNQLEKLNDENAALHSKLRDVVRSPLSDNEKQLLLLDSQRHHNSAPASIAANFLNDGSGGGGGDVTACSTPDWDKQSSSNVSEVSVACLQDKINQMQETHYSTNEELQATLQELTDLQRQLSEVQQDNERLVEEKNLMFDSLCRQTERLNDTRTEMESLKHLLYKEKDENGQYESVVEREQKLVDLLKSAQEEREMLLVKQEQLNNEIQEARSIIIQREADHLQLNERVRTLESTLDAKHAEHKQLDQELARAKDLASSRQIEIDRHKDILENARTKIIELEQDRDTRDKSELDEMLDNARKEKDALESEVAHLKEQVARGRNESDKLREQVFILQEECKVLRNNAKCTQSELEYKVEKLTHDKVLISEQLQRIEEAANELQVQANCQLEDKRQLSSVLSETQRNMSEVERRNVDLESELKEVKKLRSEENEEWEKFQNDLLTSVRVANDFKNEAQQELQNLVMENKSHREKIRQLESQIEKMKERVDDFARDLGLSERWRKGAREDVKVHRNGCAVVVGHDVLARSVSEAPKQHGRINSKHEDQVLRNLYADLETRGVYNEVVAERLRASSLENLELSETDRVSHNSQYPSNEELIRKQPVPMEDYMRYINEEYAKIDPSIAVNNLPPEQQFIVKLKKGYDRQSSIKAKPLKKLPKGSSMAISKPLMSSVYENPELKSIAESSEFINVEFQFDETYGHLNTSIEDLSVKQKEEIIMRNFPNRDSAMSRYQDSIIIEELPYTSVSTPDLRENAIQARHGVRIFSNYSTVNDALTQSNIDLRSTDINRNSRGSNDITFSKEEDYMRRVEEAHRLLGTKTSLQKRHIDKRKTKISEPIVASVLNNEKLADILDDPSISTAKPNKAKKFSFFRSNKVEDTTQLERNLSLMSKKTHKIQNYNPSTGVVTITDPKKLKKQPSAKTSFTTRYQQEIAVEPRTNNQHRGSFYTFGKEDGYEEVEVIRRSRSLDWQQFKHLVDDKENEAVYEDVGSDVRNVQRSRSFQTKHHKELDDEVDKLYAKVNKIRRQKSESFLSTASLNIDESAEKRSKSLNAQALYFLRSKSHPMPGKSSQSKEEIIYDIPNTHVRQQAQMNTGNPHKYIGHNSSSFADNYVEPYQVTQNSEINRQSGDSVIYSQIFSNKQEQNVEHSHEIQKYSTAAEANINEYLQSIQNLQTHSDEPQTTPFYYNKKPPPPPRKTPASEHRVRFALPQHNAEQNQRPPQLSTFASPKSSESVTFSTFQPVQPKSQLIRKPSYIHEDLTETRRNYLQSNAHEAEGVSYFGPPDVIDSHVSSNSDFHRTASNSFDPNSIQFTFKNMRGNTETQSQHVEDNSSGYEFKQYSDVKIYQTSFCRQDSSSSLETANIRTNSEDTQEDTQNLDGEISEICNSKCNSDFTTAHKSLGELSCDISDTHCMTRDSKGPQTIEKSGSANIHENNVTVTKFEKITTQEISEGHISQCATVPLKSSSEDKETLKCKVNIRKHIHNQSYSETSDDDLRSDSDLFADKLGNTADIRKIKDDTHIPKSSVESQSQNKLDSDRIENIETNIKYNDEHSPENTEEFVVDSFCKPWLSEQDNYWWLKNQESLDEGDLSDLNDDDLKLIMHARRISTQSELRDDDLRIIEYARGIYNRKTTHLDKDKATAINDMNEGDRVMIDHACSKHSRNNSKDSDTDYDYLRRLSLTKGDTSRSSTLSELNENDYALIEYVRGLKGLSEDESKSSTLSSHIGNEKSQSRESTLSRLNDDDLAFLAYVRKVSGTKTKSRGSSLSELNDEDWDIIKKSQNISENDVTSRSSTLSDNGKILNEYVQECSENSEEIQYRLRDPDKSSVVLGNLTRNLSIKLRSSKDAELLSTAENILQDPEQVDQKQAEFFLDMIEKSGLEEELTAEEFVSYRNNYKEVLKSLKEVFKIKANTNESDFEDDHESNQHLQENIIENKKRSEDNEVVLRRIKCDVKAMKPTSTVEYLQGKGLQNVSESKQGNEGDNNVVLRRFEHNIKDPKSEEATDLKDNIASSSNNDNSIPISNENATIHDKFSVEQDIGMKISNLTDDFKIDFTLKSSQVCTNEYERDDSFQFLASSNLIEGRNSLRKRKSCLDTENEIFQTNKPINSTEILVSNTKYLSSELINTEFNQNLPANTRVIQDNIVFGENDPNKDFSVEYSKKIYKSNSGSTSKITDETSVDMVSESSSLTENSQVEHIHSNSKKTQLESNTSEVYNTSKTPIHLPRLKIPDILNMTDVSVSHFGMDNKPPDKDVEPGEEVDETNKNHQPKLTLKTSSSYIEPIIQSNDTTVSPSMENFYEMPETSSETSESSAATNRTTESSYLNIFKRPEDKVFENLSPVKEKREFFTITMHPSERSSRSETLTTGSAEKVSDLKKRFEQSQEAPKDNKDFLELGVAFHDLKQMRNPDRTPPKKEEESGISELHEQVIDVESLASLPSPKPEVRARKSNLDIGTSRESFEMAKKMFEKK